MKKEKKAKKVSRGLFWTPRILTIVFILFLAIFSLDVFGNGYSFWQTVVALLMHNIPSFILIAVLCLAWKWELVGTIVFPILGLLYMISAIKRAGLLMGLSWSLTIAGPLFLIGILFYLGWKKRR